MGAVLYCINSIGPEMEEEVGKGGRGGKTIGRVIGSGDGRCSILITKKFKSNDGRMSFDGDEGLMDTQGLAFVGHRIAWHIRVLFLFVYRTCFHNHQ